MNPETVSEKITLEGGPHNKKTAARPDKQHATLHIPVTGFVRDEDGMPLNDKPRSGYAVYQYWEELNAAFWSHNEWNQN